MPLLFETSWTHLKKFLWNHSTRIKVCGWSNFFYWNWFIKEEKRKIETKIRKIWEKNNFLIRISSYVWGRKFRKIAWNGTSMKQVCGIIILKIGAAKYFLKRRTIWKKLNCFVYKNMQMFRGRSFLKNFPTKDSYPERAFFLITESSSRNSRDKRTVHLVENKIRVKKKEGSNPKQLQPRLII